MDSSLFLIAGVTLILVALLGGVGLLLVLPRLVKLQYTTRDSAYRRKPILTAGEYRFFLELQAVFGSRCYSFTQVRLADIMGLQELP